MGNTAQNVYIEKLASDGNGIGRVQGKVVFVPFVIPGETVDIEITEIKKQYDIGKVLEIRKPSPDRIEPKCSYHGTCGGCTLQHIKDMKQTEYKKRMLQDIFQRTGKQEINLPKAISGNYWNYRNRFQMHKADKGRVGFKKQLSTEILDIHHCPVIVPDIELVRSKLSNLGPGRYTVWAEDSSQLFIENINKEISTTILSTHIQFDMSGFFQSNKQMLEKLLKKIHVYWYGTSGADLYAGVGVLSLHIMEKMQKSILVENDSKAIPHLKANTDRFNPSIIEMPVETALSRYKNNFKNLDTILLDPPRSGIHKKAVSALSEVKPKRILYCSCNPVTLARDMKRFHSRGYHLQHIELFDFYPQTPHMECLTIIEENR